MKHIVNAKLILPCLAGIFIFAGLTSCKRELQKTDELLTLDFKLEQGLDPAGMLETAFIKLETNDACFIKTVVQVESAMGKIFLLSGGDWRLLVFDPSGKFVTQVGARGNGPGEYIAPISFSIDPYEKRLSVIDGAQEKIIHYDLQDYRFLSEEKPPYKSLGLEYAGDDRIVWKNIDYSSADYAGWSYLVSGRDHTLQKKYVKNEFMSGYLSGPMKTIYKCKEDILAYTQYDPVVYRFPEDTIVPQYRLSFGKYQLPPIDYLQKISAGYADFMPELKQSNYVFYYTVFETGETLVVLYTVAETPYIGIYDKKHRRIDAYTRQEFEDKLGAGKIERLSGTMDDYIVAVLQPFDLLEKKAENYTFLPQLQELLTQTSDDDNPILLLFKVKK
ncbi:MAG: 6-bladed beta-propeller [Tannerella sp.]|jgi:hypothetical protein|nr:6-bladed beta-propeller [Tannerella sp.]